MIPSQIPIFFNTQINNVGLELVYFAETENFLLKVL